MGYNNFDNHNSSTGYTNMDSIFNPGRMNQNNLPQLNRNYLIVTSLQEALGKESPYNSKGLYVHQDGEYEFEVFTDSNGRKTYEIYKRVKCTNENEILTVPKNEYMELKEKIIKLEEKVYGRPSNDITNGDAKM